VGRQWERHPNQAVLDEVREVVRVLAVDTKVIGVNRTKQRIVRVLIAYAPLLQVVESSPGGRRRKLERIRRHVTIGARASIAAQPFQAPVMKRPASTLDRITWSAVASVRLSHGPGSHRTDVSRENHRGENRCGD